MFCRIYISDLKEKHNSLIEELSKLFEVWKLDDSNLKVGELNLELRKSKDFDKIKLEEYPDGFIYFPFIIEIYSDDDVEIGSAPEIVGKILKYLWAERIAAIASCDFENLLPENGGYKSKNVTWWKIILRIEIFQIW
jgi:hypothetical protein